MQTLNYFTIPFFPNHKNIKINCLIEFLVKNQIIGNYEDIGEKFLGCANINPIVKAIVGYLSEIKFKDLTYIFFSSKFISKDVFTALEYFKKTKFLKLIDVDLKQKNIQNLILNFNNNFKLSNDNSNLSFNDKIFELTKDSNKVNIIIIGTTPILYYDLIDFFISNKVNVAYIEYYDYLKLPIVKQKKILDLNQRLVNIIKIINKFKSENINNIGVVHLFPKFSHYEIENYFFIKNIDIKYLSCEYSGGGKLSEKDKIKLETFINIIKNQ